MLNDSADDPSLSIRAARLTVNDVDIDRIEEDGSRQTNAGRREMKSVVIDLKRKVREIYRWEEPVGIAANHAIKEKGSRKITLEYCTCLDETLHHLISEKRRRLCLTSQSRSVRRRRKRKRC